MPGRKHGSRGSISMDPTGGATVVPVADLNAWTLDMARDTVDVTAFGDVVKQYVLGLPDVKGTYGGWWKLRESSGAVRRRASGRPRHVEPHSVARRGDLLLRRTGVPRRLDRGRVGWRGESQWKLRRRRTVGVGRRDDVDGAASGGRARGITGGGWRVSAASSGGSIGAISPPPRSTDSRSPAICGPGRR